MPTRGTRKPKPKTIGFFGLGETSPKNIKALLERVITEDDAKTATFVLPATKDTFEPVEAIVDWMDDQEIAYEVVTDGEDTPRNLRSLVKNANKVHKAEEIGIGIVSVLKEAEGDVRFFVLYDEDLDEEHDGGCEEAVGAALDADIACFDLCNALEPMAWDDDDDDDKPSKSKAAKDDEPEEKPRRSARSAKVEEEEVADDGESASEFDIDRSGLPPYAEASKLGVRAVRQLLRDLLPDKKHRAVGSMDKESVLATLYPKGADTATAAGTKAAPAADIDEEVSAAARKATKAAVSNGSSNGHTGAGDAIIELIAQAVAARVKELVDA